jgi:hypothetical protein
MDNFEVSSRRTDEQLEAILDEAGHWAVYGRLGQVLCTAASLRRAINRAHEFGLSGAVLTAICRLPSDDIIIFVEQINRLRGIIAVHELVPHRAARPASGDMGNAAA